MVPPPELAGAKLLSGTAAPRHFTTRDLRQLGANVCKALIPYCGLDKVEIPPREVARIQPSLSKAGAHSVAP